MSKKDQTDMMIDKKKGNENFNKFSGCRSVSQDAFAKSQGYPGALMATHPLKADMPPQLGGWRLILHNYGPKYQW